MSSFNLDAREKRKQFAAYFKELEDRIANLERANQLNQASIEGGALDIYDEDGVLKGSVGVQIDGTVALVPEPENTDPPPTPAAPTVDSALAGLDITWSGQWADSEAAPSDFALVQVHVGTSADFTPNAATQVSQINDVTGGKATVHVEGYDPVWVRLVAVNTAALTGDPSDAVQGQARQAVSQDLIDGIVTEVKIANEAISEAKLALGAVTTDKIAEGAVNDLLLADDAVTAAKLAAGSVGTVALADGAVLSDKLADNAVTQAKVAANAVTELALANSAVTSAKVAVGAIDSTRIADAAVSAAKIGAAAVTTAAIATDAVTSAQLATNSVTASELAAGAVTAGKIAAGSVTATEIAASTITSGQLAANSVTATQLAAGSVQTAALAADSVAAGKIAADAITARELAANSVTAAEISAGAVTASALAAGSVTTDKLTVAGGANLLSDPSFEGAYSAVLVAGSSSFSIDTTGNGSAKSLKLNAVAASATTKSQKITTLPILAGDQLFLAFDYLTSSDYTSTAIPKLYARWEDSTGATLGWGVAQPAMVVFGGTTWNRPTATVTAPASTVQASIWAESYQAAAGTLWFDNVAVRPVVAGVQIADGAITTPKMVVGSIQGDRIAVGSLAADRIVSGSITTSQLNVTTAASVLQKFYDTGADAGKWRIGGTSTTTATTPSNLTSVQVTDAQTGSYVMRAVAGIVGGWRPDVLIPFDPGVLYRIVFTVRQTVAGSDTAQQRVYLGVGGVAVDATTLVNISGSASVSSQHYVAGDAQNLTAGGGWQRFTGYLKGYAASGASGTRGTTSPTAPGVLHANARYITPFFYANYSAGTGTAEIGVVTIEVVETGAVQTVNIADGAITANKILANAVTADKIVGLSITGDKIAANAITTDKIAALAVTASQLAANSVTATQLAAGAVTATAIAAGTITADKLDASAINGKTITGATVQTAATGQRLVLNPDGTLYLYTGDAAETAPGKIVAEGGSYPALRLRAPDNSSKTGAEIVMWTAPDGSSEYAIGQFRVSRTAAGADSISLYGGELDIGTAYAEKVSAGNIKCGRVTITPSAANTPTSVTVTGLGLTGSSPRAVATPSTTVPGTAVTGVGCTNVSTDSVTIWVTRTNTTSVGVDYIVMAS
ncbi:beta strand repeat-containing protein [Streptomyces sp. NPDC090499]|uniref:beta strand repeat-containing protein n=1 Tax=Streptomyces sp. NPDC090499 TaxID=3365965 RepID=UPI0038156D77